MGKHSKPKPKSRGTTIVGIATGIALATPSNALAGEEDPPLPTPNSSTTQPIPQTQTQTRSSINWDPIIQCESGNRNIESFDPNSSASGYFQFIDSTWAHFGGREFAPRAIQATKEQQTIVADRAFARNGLRDWNASKRCWGPKESTIRSTTVTNVAPNTTSSTPIVTSQNAVVRLAMDLGDDGIPYVYGGKTTRGFDCSGFVSYVLNQTGLMTGYRNSSALRGWAIPISANEARPGDLTFTPGHVGIYLGNGMIADAGNTRTDVTVRRMWDAPNRTFGRPRGAIQG